MKPKFSSKTEACLFQISEATKYTSPETDFIAKYDPIKKETTVVSKGKNELIIHGPTSAKIISEESCNSSDGLSAGGFLNSKLDENIQCLTNKKCAGQEVSLGNFKSSDIYQD